MQQSHLPVSSAVFVFLQEISATPVGAKAAEGHSLSRNSDTGGYSLCLDSYEFAMGELDSILYFLSIQPSKLRNRVGEIIITNCGLVDEDCDIISNHLPNFPWLEVLSLKHNDISSTGAEKICVTLMVCESQIESLRFDYNHIDGKRIKKMAQIYRFCPLLTDLSFSHNPITDTGLYYLLQAIMNPLRKRCSSLPVPPSLTAALTTVDMENSNLDEIEDIDTDEESEPKNGGLNGFSNEQLSSGIMSPNQSSSFKLARRISMQEKRVMTSKKSRRTCIAMRNRIEAKWIELGIIGLGGGSLMEGADINMSKARISRVFKRCVLKLKALGLFLSLPRRGVDVYSLCLEGIHLSSYAGCMLKVALIENTYVKELHLSNNAISDDGIHGICDIVKDKGIALSVLSLHHTGLSENGVKLVTQAALSSLHLHSLDLSGNLLTPTSVNWIAAATGVYFIDDLSLTSIDRFERQKHFDALCNDREILQPDMSSRRKSDFYSQGDGRNV